MKISELKGNPQNPRRITDEKLKMLKASLEEFGDLSGIVFNRRTKRLVGGHQRVKVLPTNADIIIEREFKKPNRVGTVAKGSIVLDGEGFVYREVDWDETKEKAANIAANQHGGDWELPQLAEWLLELDHQNYNMDLVGFDQKELEDLMAPIRAIEQPGCDEDEVPEHVEPKTRMGDLYQLGSHRLLCGDSTSITDVERLMNGEKADMVFTDPPYGMKLDTDWSEAKSDLKFYQEKGCKGQGNKYKKVIGDNDDFTPELIQTVFASFPEAKEVFMWGGDYYAEHLPHKNEGSWIVWDKRVDETMDRMYGSCFELCWSREKHKREIARIRWAGIFGTEKEPDQDKSRKHPTQKPVQLAEFFFEKWGKESKSVIDLFGGSGSTLIACEKTNRRCFMMEIDPHYCDVIVARWEKYTGKHARLLTGAGAALDA